MVPVDVDCDMETSYFYSWLCFVSIELFLLLSADLIIY